MNKLGKNTKTAKADKFGFENYILHLSPVKMAAKVFNAHKEQVHSLVEKRMGRHVSIYEIKEALKDFNTCPHAGACAGYCLNTAGRGKFSNVQIARAAKTIHYALAPTKFESELFDEIERLRKKHGSKKLAIRLNGTSDLDFTSLIGAFEKDGVQFYDYSKDIERMNKWINGELPKNYHLTYSYDRNNDGTLDKQGEIEYILSHSTAKIAIMQGDYDKLNFVQHGVKNFPTINGDEHDLRFLDRGIKKPGFVILQEKGDAKK